MRRYINFIIACAVILSGAAYATGLNLNVVYPHQGQNLPAIDSTFIFGSVDPEASLTVNGYSVPVHKEGGWLAFVPVSPDTFQFQIRAEKEGIVDTATVTVQLPPLLKDSYDSLYFQPGTLLPRESLSVTSGDEIPLSCRATPYCNVFCEIIPTGDTVYLRELPPVGYYTGNSIFDNNMDAYRPPDKSLYMKGIYQGAYVVPDTAADSLKIVYHIYPPSPEQINWLMQHSDSLSRQALPYHKLETLSGICTDTSPVAVEVIDRNHLPVVELTDSMTVIRSGPQKGYLAIHQPAGIRMQMIGRQGNWLRVKLSERQDGWMPDTSAVILPAGFTVPHSYVRRIGTTEYDDRVGLTVSTTGRHPFTVTENEEEQTITVTLFGVDTDTDWIRYDTKDKVIDYIQWHQDAPGEYSLIIHLAADRIWGYDGYYVGNEFHFDIRKAPRDARHIEGMHFVIDPGHSPDPGAIGPIGLLEKDANLAIAEALAKELKRKGATVIMTRSDDSPLPLYDRPKIALANHADIFISIHNNALPDGVNPFTNNGVSTYYYHPHSHDLAAAVQNALAHDIGLNDFGLFHGNLAVNRPTQYPAILVECAFMIIPEQESLLKTESFQKKVAGAIVEGVDDFLRGHALTAWDRQVRQSYDWR